MLRVRRPLRYKFLLLTTALLVGSVVVHVWLATQIFRDDKTSLVFELNRSLVTGLKNELSHRIETVFEKMSAWAILLHERGQSDLGRLAGQQSDVVLLARPAEDGLLQTVMVSDKFLETYGWSVEKLQETVNKEIQPRLKSQDKLVLSVTLEGLPKLLALQRIVIEEDQAGRKIRQTPLIALVSVDSVIETMKSSTSTRVTVVDSQGQVLLTSHSSSNLLPELLKASMDSPSETMVMKVRDDKNKQYLGAYSRDRNFTILASTDSDYVFAVVGQLVRRSILFGLIVVSAAFLLILIFSKSITRPLEVLTSAMQKVSGGDLTQHLNLSSDDEISVLSATFNEMITEVKVSREALEETNKNLEFKVAERTRQLEEQNRAVKEAQEALLRTTRLASVGEIAGRAAHEVLNPLTGILARLERIQKRLSLHHQKEVGLLKEIQSGWVKELEAGGFSKLATSLQAPSQILQGKTLLEEDLSNLEVISNSIQEEHDTLVEDAKFLTSESQRINRIVSQMRSLSHMKRELRMESINKLLSECCKIMADLFDRDGVSLNLEARANTDDAFVNRDEFIQMITNMLRNSLHAIRMSESSMGVVVIRTLNDGDKIMIDIVDNGIGMKEEDKTKLFANNFSTKDPSEGTGMGLSIARRFARGFEGDVILLKSDFGSGTTFRITLPKAISEPMRGYGT